jgi:AcrR family transcriptional regulator
MKRTREEAAATKASILNKALELFIRKGYSNTSQEDIVFALGLTRGAFYGHFKSKEDLFRQLLNEEFGFISNLAAESFIEHANVKIQIEKLLENVIRNFFDNIRFRNFIELTWFRLELDPDSETFKAKTCFNEFFIEQLEGLIQKASDSGLCHPSVVPLEAAIQVTTMVNGIYRLHFITPRYLGDKNQALKVCRSFTRLLFLE